jgi:hypothetical protein
MFGASGCGFFKAVLNPSAAWAITESGTPMSVVFRRAEVAHGVAEQVDRLLDQTPIDGSASGALALTAADAETRLKGIGSDPVYAGGQPVRVVPAEAWLNTFSNACAKDGDARSLVEMLGDDVTTDYRAVTGQAEKIATLKAKISTLEDKAGAEGVSESDAKKHTDAIAKAEEEIVEIEASYEPAMEKLLASVQAAAAKVSAEDKKVMSPIVLNLIEAVDDAKNANSAAVMQYPMAIPGLQDDLPGSVKRFVGDVVEEQTGSRPDMAKFNPEVKLEGGDVKLSLNGIPAEKLGDLDPEALLTEVTLRTTKYVERTLTLAVYISETDDRLSFQTDLLDAWQAGLQASVEGTEGAVDISDLEVVSGGAAPKAKGAEGEDAKAKRSIGGIRVAACASLAGDQAVAKADENEDEADDAEEEEAPEEKPKKAKKTKVAKKKRAKKRRESAPRIATTLDVPKKRKKARPTKAQRKLRVANRRSLDEPKKPSWQTARKKKPGAPRTGGQGDLQIDSEVEARYLD